MSPLTVCIPAEHTCSSHDDAVVGLMQGLPAARLPNSSEASGGLKAWPAPGSGPDGQALEEEELARSLLSFSGLVCVCGDGKYVHKLEIRRKREMETSRGAGRWNQRPRGRGAEDVDGAETRERNRAGEGGRDERGRNKTEADLKGRGMETKRRLGKD